jgi:hypothetical protein
MNQTQRPTCTLVRGNQVHRRVHDFSKPIRGVIDKLNTGQR